jgi:hypothetical protein
MRAGSKRMVEIDRLARAEKKGDRGQKDDGEKEDKPRS